ncbi:MAG TPA: hypothetical protein PK616_07030, partial [Fibrobacteraceae bacterium]|nr:hypothetical protein [Fibrobacteraceae bacterium]
MNFKKITFLALLVSTLAFAADANTTKTAATPAPVKKEAVAPAKKEAAAPAKKEAAAPAKKEAAAP